MSAVVSGLIGGVVAVVLTSYIASRVGKSGVPGELRYGFFMWGLASACLLFALFPIAITLAGNDKELWAKVGLFVGFGVAAVYCFGEAAFVRGSFDEDGIAFSTPWTGRQNERWKDLKSLELNAACNWYTLTFNSGKKVRLSLYLRGHMSAVEMAHARREL
jgi:hypothetical protein